jgi:Rho family protein
LLLTSQIHNACQLSEWCLHFISTNFTVFTRRPEFKLLQGDNLLYVEEHQWPPVSYLKEIEEYEKMITNMQKKKEGKCCIM